MPFSACFRAVFYFKRVFYLKKNNIKKMTVTAVLCSLAYLCTFLLHFKVSFLTFDFKDAIITVISLMYGPLYGLFSSGLVAFIEFVTVSDTGVYGLIMNFLSSAAFSVTAGIIYKHKRNFSGAIFAIIGAVISVISVMLLANMFITPLYLAGKSVTRSEVFALIPTLLLPFNCVKAVMNAAITLIIYRPITDIFKRMSLIERNKDIPKNNTKSIILLLCSLLVILLAILVFVFYLDGSFSWI
jgi:riboflavin transporter FmnP